MLPTRLLPLYSCLWLVLVLNAAFCGKLTLHVLRWMPRLPV